MAAEGPLECPSCSERCPSTERFCPACGMPLVHEGGGEWQAGADEDGRRRLAARKVDPRYAEGEPVKVVGARNQTEAEFIQGLLLEEGIPSMQRRMMGFEVPDFLAAGPRDVLVPASGLQAARDVLLQSDLISEQQHGGAQPMPWRVLLWLIAGLAVAAIAVALIVQR